MTSTSPARTPDAHVAVALHAVTTHMVMNELPPPLDLWADDRAVNVQLTEPVFDHWAVSLCDERHVEVAGVIIDGHQAVHLETTLPDTGVRVRLRCTRLVASAPVAGRHRLAVVHA